jgi:hypothetical protein
MSDDYEIQNQTVIGGKKMQTGLPDRLNAQIGVLTRREVEARILAPMIGSLGTLRVSGGRLPGPFCAIAEILDPRRSAAN